MTSHNFLYDLRSTPTKAGQFVLFFPTDSKRYIGSRFWRTWKKADVII